MNDESIRIFQLGDAALTVEFGTEISASINKRAISLALHFERDRFPGFIEAVPAYASTTVFYDLCAVRRHFPQFPTAFDAIQALTNAALKIRCEIEAPNTRIVEIPVYFDDGSGPDLEYVAERSCLSKIKVIETFTAATYRVFMVGFLPGFSYLGEVDATIATPRKETPRLLVPKGSVGIAGKQTGIYSLDSPGGWQIVGRTDLEMFTPKAETPCLLTPGDQVRFVAIK